MTPPAALPALPRGKILPALPAQEKRGRDPIKPWNFWANRIFLCCSHTLWDWGCACLVALGTLRQLARPHSHLHQWLSSRAARWLQKIPSASRAAYGILINNRLIDLSLLRNVVCLCRGSALGQWLRSKGLSWRCPSVTWGPQEGQGRAGIPQLPLWEFQRGQGGDPSAVNRILMGYVHHKPLNYGDIC